MTLTNYKLFQVKTMMYGLKNLKTKITITDEKETKVKLWPDKENGPRKHVLKE